MKYLLVLLLLFTPSLAYADVEFNRVFVSCFNSVITQIFDSYTLCESSSGGGGGGGSSSSSSSESFLGQGEFASPEYNLNNIYNVQKVSSDISQTSEKLNDPLIILVLIIVILFGYLLGKNSIKSRKRKSKYRLKSTSDILKSGN
jgi:hypothetical protein